jgi:hypothetical protein
MLAASTDLAKVIGKGIHEKQHPDKISSLAYQAIWGQQNRGQRDFQVLQRLVIQWTFLSSPLPLISSSSHLLFLSSPLFSY